MSVLFLSLTIMPPKKKLGVFQQFAHDLIVQWLRTSPLLTLPLLEAREWLDSALFTHPGWQDMVVVATDWETVEFDDEEFETTTATTKKVVHIPPVEFHPDDKVHIVFQRVYWLGCCLLDQRQVHCDTIECMSPYLVEQAISTRAYKRWTEDVAQTMANWEVYYRSEYLCLQDWLENDNTHDALLHALEQQRFFVKAYEVDSTRWKECAQHESEIADNSDQALVANTLFHKCPFCRCNQLYCVNPQTRSPDEESSVFYHCLNCKKHWKDR